MLVINVALVLLLAKCFLWPTDDPREEWWPSEWGVPWHPSTRSWASVAAERKAQLAKSRPSDGVIAGGGAQGEAVSTPYVPARPARLKYPILWAAPFFSRSGKASAREGAGNGVARCLQLRGSACRGGLRQLGMHHTPHHAHCMH
jgi:hypothetical protein